MRCSVDGQKRYGNDKCGHKSGRDRVKSLVLNSVQIFNYNAEL